MKRSGPMLPAPNADVAAACGSIVLPRCRRCEGSLQGRVTGLAGRFSFGGAAVSSGAASGSSASKSTSAKDVAKLTKDIIHTHPATKASSSTSHTCMTKLIISLFLFSTA